MAAVRKAPVDDSGTVLAYIDSGPPPNDVYSTVVLIHGHGYNSQTFIRLLPLAPSYNLRIIALNRRDYTESTPYSEEDLGLLFSGDVKDHQRFLCARGLEVARFLAWVIDEFKIPPADPNIERRSPGGLTLLGWSLGSITTLSFLRHLSSFPKELVTKLEPYLKTFIMYDSGYATLGYPHPTGMYHPFRDTSISKRERNTAFVAWISSYYTHPYYTSTVPEVSRTLDQLALRSGALLTSADTVTTEDKDGGPFKLPSYENIDPNAFAAALETFPERSEMAFHHTVRPETLYDLLAGSLFLSEPPTALPDLRVYYLYGTHSPWTTQWCLWSLEADIASHSEDIKRPIDLVRVEGGNHFRHWDDPDKFLGLLAKLSK